MFTTVTVGNLSNEARWKAATCGGSIRTAPSKDTGRSASAGGLKTQLLVGMNLRCSHSCSATTRARMGRPEASISIQPPTEMPSRLAASTLTETTAGASGASAALLHQD